MAATFVDDERLNEDSQQTELDFDDPSQADGDTHQDHQDAVPDKYAGKSVQEIVRMHQEAEKLLGALGTEYKPFGDNPLEMLNKNGILFVHDTNGVRIDIHLCDTAFDNSTIERATSIEIAPGSPVMVCSAEDLVIYKMLSTRPSDARDFEGIIDCQGDALDDQYIIYWLKQFEAALDDSTLINTYKRMRGEK